MYAALNDRTATAVKVLIVDDDAFMRRGLCLYLATEGFETVEAVNEWDAWQIIQANDGHTPPIDVSVVDISIPPDGETPSRPAHNFGLRLVGRIKAAYPAMPVVLLSAYEDRGCEVTDMLRDGVRGLAYKLKGCAPDELLVAIDRTRSGQVLIDPAVTNPRTLADELLDRLSPDEYPWVTMALSRYDQLSEREAAVVSRLAASHSVESITNALKLSPKTVENYVGRAYDKLGLCDTPPHLRRQTLLTKTCMIRDLQCNHS